MEIILRKILSLIGKTFDKYTVIERVANSSDNHTRWLCKCICGRKKIVIGKHLQSGASKSCGCSRRKGEGWLSTATKIHQQMYSDGDITIEKFIELSQLNCSYCGIEPHTTANRAKYSGSKVSIERQEECYWTYNGLDRINSNRGHYLGNVVTCCRWCNQMKLQYSKEAFLSHIEKIYNHMKKSDR